MTTSSTYLFNPTGGELIAYAFGMCGIRRTAILQEHMVDARMALNLKLSEWGNDTPNLWTVDLVETTLVAGTATYDVDPSTVMILDAYIRTGSGETVNDRIIWPVSRTEYAAYPNKSAQSPPTTFWFDRLLSPTITLWQVPDDQETYKLRYYRCTAIQDANLPNGETVAIPPLWLNAVAFGLAGQLAVSYAPDRAQALDQKAEGLKTRAMEQNTENVNLWIFPMIGSYRPRG